MSGRAKVVDYDSMAIVSERPVPPQFQFAGQLGADSPVVACTAEEDRARQEYGLESDISYQISKFGVGHPMVHGELDFDALDLTRAMELIDESQARWMTLPKVVRDRYQSWANVEKAAASGELEQLLKAAGVDAGSSASSPTASASGSAPVA